MIIYVIDNFHQQVSMLTSLFIIHRDSVHKIYYTAYGRMPSEVFCCSQIIAIYYVIIIYN